MNTEKFSVDFRSVRKVFSLADSLASLHKDHDHEATRLGVLAEYAAIYFINIVQQPLKRIPFRWNYKNGKDGGFDFQIQDLKFDVKLMRKGRFETELVRSSNAHILYFMAYHGVKQRGYCFSAWGFMPKSAVDQSKKEIHASQLIRPQALKQIFPAWFSSSTGRMTQPVRDLSKFMQCSTNIKYIGGQNGIE